jgi:hypothetical protein
VLKVRPEDTFGYQDHIFILELCVCNESLPRQESKPDVGSFNKDYGKQPFSVGPFPMGIICLISKAFYCL